MRRASDERPLSVILGAILLVGACGERPQPPDDPYLADLKQRIERLKPEVEREIGRKLRKVEVVVLPREKIVEESIPWARETLARIENGPRGEEIEPQARALAEGVAEWCIAHVDSRGRIVFPDPADQESLFRLVMGFFPKSDFVKDPRALDLILLHELVHVHQHWHLATPAFHASAGSRADILARAAVLEGHAEYLTRRIATRIGLADLYEKYLARSDAPPGAKEPFKFEHRVAAADQLFAYTQGAAFVASVVEKRGYDEAVRRIFKNPPTLAALSRPEVYFEKNEPSRWGPVAEDLRRWLARERGEASVEVIALPMVREMCGTAAEGFREGFKLSVNRVDVNIVVLIAADEGAARELHLAWTRTLDRLHQGRMETGFFDEVSLSRKPDDWTLHYDWSCGHWRENVIREGNLVLDVSCHDDSELERGAERLAGRAFRFLTDAAWREAWLRGDEALLKSEDLGLRLAAVSRMRRFVPDTDWEVRWLGRFYEAKDEKKDESERIAALVAAIEDPDPAVVARALRALIDLNLRKVPWPLLRERLRHDEADVRRAAWALMETSIGADDPEFQVPDAEALVLMRRALDDEDVAVREEAAECLSNFHDEPGLLEFLRKALTDEHARVREAALIRLTNYAFDFPQLIPEIVELLDERPDLAAEALGNLGEDAEAALPRLREAVKGPKDRAEVALAIYRISFDPEPLLAYVKESAADGDPDGIQFVGQLGSAARPVVPEVALDLAHDNRWARIAAAEALGEIGGKEAKEALTRRLDKERDAKVIEALRKALAELKDGS